jgi:signal transduction histidine kinase
MELDILGLRKRMSKMKIIIFGALFLVLAAVFIVLYNRKKEKETLQKFNDMLDSAIAGSFSNTSYDETRLSALESKLNRFLILSKSSELRIGEEKDKIKSLVSDISHQTKTPLSNIMMYTQLLEEQEELSEISQGLVNEMKNQSDKLSFLIHALVKTSRLETGIVSVKPQPAHVKELLENCVNDIVKKADDKNIVVSLSCEEDIKAFFDPKWTEEAIFNILDNAVKYTPKEGIVSISVKVYELFTCIDIKDTGIGIEEYEINNIFKRFYRVSSVSQYEGVGIGLYLARETLASESAYIKVKSNLGKGTTFSVFLPNINK